MVSRIVGSALCLVAYAQQSGDLGARRLYYNDNSPELVFKSTTIAPKPKPPVKTPPDASKAKRMENIQQALRSASAAADLKPAANLGVRYNILKVIAKTNQRTEVSPDTVFHEKDCAAVRIQPNRGGFLYVFSEGSSGQWQAMIPSPETAGDANVVQPYTLHDVPEKYCFEMDDRPGTERLLIVVTDKPEDVMKLNDALKQTANLAARDLQPFTSSLQGRDLKITRVGNQPAAGEAPYSTYLVHGAATTSDRLVLEIKLKHEK
jgi:hypothetical protein